MGLATRYIIDLQENLRLILRQPADREMLHQFRVQIKKMKAVWLLHPIGNTIAFKTSFPIIDKLYHGAAGIRDRQMILSCLETLPDFDKYPELKKKSRASIKRKLKAFRDKLATRRSRFGILEENRLFREYFKVAASFLIRQNRKAFREETFQKLAEVSGNDPKELHKVRRVCKQLLFQCDAFHASNNGHQQRVSRAALDKLQHNLGTWHDWWNTFDWLSKKQSKHTGLVSLLPLLKQAEKKETLLRLEAMKEIKAMLPKATLAAGRKG